MSDRLLGLFPRLDPQSLGGVQLSGRLAWEGLTAALDRRGGSAQLFCYAPDAPADLLHLPGATVATSKAAAFSAILRRRWDADQVLIWHLGLLRLLPLFRLRNARIALMLLGVEAWHRHDPLTRLLLQRVNLFLSISDHTWRRFLDVYPNLRTRAHRTVYLGVDEPIAGPVPQPGHPPVALIISRLVRGEDYKGHRELIGAWRLLLERVPGAELWVAGDGDLRPDLEQLAREHGVEHHIRFMGRVSEPQKQELLTHCRCLALPSRGEGFGLVYLEAMRLGRPCLVSTLDAGREVVNPPEAGLAVHPTQPGELVAALQRLLVAGAEWECWSEQARRRYEQHFTAAHYQARLVEALRY